VAESAAECVQEACWFFGLLQKIYTFFTASTQRWETLQAQILLGNDKKKLLSKIHLTHAGQLEQTLVKV
jgi:hypothetical protein